MWTSVAVLAASDSADALSDALMDCGAISVGLEDADAGTEREEPQFGEPGSPAQPLWAHSRVVALFAQHANVSTAVAAALEQAGLPTTQSWEATPVDEQDWVRLTQSQFDPIRITDRLWIVPSWHTAPDPTAVNLVLDPGLAFGTGSHPTTCLCLQWLARLNLTGTQLLDYGCGSGILAIAAARLGAPEVTGIDIDPAAVESAGQNAAANGVALRLMHAAEHLDGDFDVVVANILANPLCVLAPLLAQATRPGGQLALSGILAPQARMVIDTYAPWIALEVAGEDDGWVLLTGTKPPAQEPGAC